MHSKKGRKMRKIGFVSLNDGVKEVLPKSFRIKSRAERRRMCLTMLNAKLSKKASFDVADTALFHHNLLEIFTQKIFSFFPIYRLRPHSQQRVVKVLREESLLFTQFFKQHSHPKARYFTRHDRFDPYYAAVSVSSAHPAAELIAMIFNGKEIELMLGLDELFAELVYLRMKDNNPDADVTLDAPYIHVNANGNRTRIYPRWKRIKPNDLARHATQIDEGFDQLREVDQCYLVYPKQDDFKRHIVLKNREKEQIKMIPYSFTFCNRKGRRCQR
jgi:hypothetical protein